MHNFFVENADLSGEYFNITGSDYNHIKNVLRMQIGDLFLVSCNNTSHLCSLESLNDNTAKAKIVEKNYNNTALPIKLYLFQALPKGDKMELIIQKAVELGVSGIIPVEMNRCVVRLDEKKKKTKQIRWQAIAESAAKQSKRNEIPVIFDTLKYNSALQKANELDILLVPYENKEGMTATADALKSIKSGMSVGILIGPEGGFDTNEISSAINSDAKIISLGKRILRTETAAITAVGMCMLYAEMNLE